MDKKIVKNREICGNLFYRFKLFEIKHYHDPSLVEIIEYQDYYDTSPVVETTGYVGLC